MTEQFYAILSLLLSLAVGGVLFAFYKLKREPIFLPWLTIWILLSLHFAFLMMLDHSGGPLLWAITRWCSAMAALGLAYAAREYAGQPRRWGWFGGAAAFAALWCAYHAIAHLDRLGEARGPFWFNAAASGWACVSFWQSRRLRGSLAVRLLAGVSLVWTIINIAPAALSRTAFESIRSGFLAVSLFNLLLIAAAILILTF